MTPAQIANIGAGMQFERRLFEQQGAGLGLVIAQHLVTLHGGSLEIESDPGVQTTVRVTLLLAQPDTPPSTQGEEADHAPNSDH